MGCDCGCGGTCPMCAPRLAQEMSDRAWEINKVAEQVNTGSTNKSTATKEKEVNKMARILVFVYKVNPEQLGNGIYPMVACFTTLGIHVPFTFLAHSENEYLRDICDPTPCDGSCENHSGHVDDFSQQSDYTGYKRAIIVEKAMAFSKQNA